MTEGRECGKRSFPDAHALIVRRICGFEGVLSLPFLDSSMVEHSAVNRRVVGSSPTRGVQMNKKPADYSAVKATRKGRCSCYSGPMVKRLRHRPFTAVTAVRICLGSLPCAVREMLASAVRARHKTSVRETFRRAASWIFSSVGQSSRLITDRSWVRVPEDPFLIRPSGEVGYRAALSRRRSTVRVRSGSRGGQAVWPARNFQRHTHLPVWRNWQTQGT